MKWLNKDSNGTINFDEYFNYIDSIRSSISKETYDFASNWELYSLDSRSSLHDSWLESLVINEVGSGDRDASRECSIILSLFGAYHDRIITLEYIGVERYSINSIDLKNASRGHSDLLMHEIRLSDNGLIVHEVVFTNGSSFEIVFNGLVHSEKCN